MEESGALTLIGLENIVYDPLIRKPVRYSVQSSVFSSRFRAVLGALFIVVLAKTRGLCLILISANSRHLNHPSLCLYFFYLLFPPNYYFESHF